MIEVGSYWKAPDNQEYLVTHHLDQRQINNLELDPSKEWYSVESDNLIRNDEIMIILEEDFQKFIPIIRGKRAHENE